MYNFLAIRFCFFNSEILLLTPISYWQYAYIFHLQNYPLCLCCNAVQFQIKKGPLLQVRISILFSHNQLLNLEWKIYIWTVKFRSFETGDPKFDHILGKLYISNVQMAIRNCFDPIIWLNTVNNLREKSGHRLKFRTYWIKFDHSN